MRQVIAFIFLAFLACTTFATWTAVNPSPTMLIQQCPRSQSSLWVMDYNGLMKSTSKTTIQWISKSLPNNVIAIYLEVAPNNDACVVDEFYDVRVLKSGNTNWVTLPVVSTTETVIKVALFGYTSGGIIANTYEGSVFKFSGSSWTQLSSYTTFPIVHVAIAGDGSIFGLTPSGSLHQYNTTSSAWSSTAISSGQNLSQVSAGHTSDELVATSSNVLFPNFVKSGSGLSSSLLGASNKSWLSHGGDKITGCDSSNVYLWN